MNARFEPARRVALSLLSLALLRGESCGEGLVKNSAFALWCGDQLCDWQLEAGHIERSPTWDRREIGVALLDDGTALAQTSTESPVCLSFDLLADTQDATVILEMDFESDGTIEYSQPITSTHFTPLKYKITPPSWYDRVTFRVRKQGAGRAVLGRVRVQADSDCATAPIQLPHRPIGAGCGADTECDSGHCAGGTDQSLGRCSACRADADCGGAQICAPGAPTRYGRPFVCTATRSKGLGAACQSDRECGGPGICCGGRCAECCGDEVPGACGGTASCVLAPILNISAYLCSDIRRLSGEACLRDSQCQSGDCRAPEPESSCWISGAACMEGDSCICVTYPQGGTCR
ncbi:MAG: hypothetical protein U1E65_32630 [Myxococcota bacterium]